MEHIDYLVKLIIIGDPHVGKSSLLSRYCESRFDVHNPCTMGIDYRVKTVEIDDRRIKVNIWDTAGQERYQSISSCYYRGVNAILLVFDLTDFSTFERIQTWLNRIEKFVDPDSQYKIMVVGNKCDAPKLIDETIVDQYLKQKDLLYIKTSAKSDINVGLMFEQIVKLVIKDSAPIKPTSVLQVVSSDIPINDSCC